MNTVRIYPGFFNSRRHGMTERPRVTAHVATFPVKPTVVHKPTNPRAIYMMPVVVVAAAIGSIAAGAAGAAALVGGAITMGTVLAGAMVVGGAATLIGVATGNDKLVKYGGIISAVGGIGTLAFNAISSAGGAASSMAGISGEAAGSIEAAEAGLSASGESVATAGLGANPTGMLSTNAGPPPPPAVAPSVEPPAIAPTTPPPAQAPAPGVTPPTASAPAATPFQATTPPATNVTTPQAPSTGLLGDVGKFVKDNPGAAMMGMNALSSFAGGLVTPPTSAAQQAQIDYSNNTTAQQNYLVDRKSRIGAGRSPLTFEQWKQQGGK